MSPFQKETSQIIEILDHAQKQIESIENPSIQWLKTKIVMDLKRHSNALKQNLGVDISSDLPKPKVAPLTKLFGKEITGKAPVVKDVNKPFRQSSFEVEQKELELKVSELYPRFLTTESDHLLDSLNDIEIRGVAKKAGLPVTETNPKKIDVTFINQIKDAIRLQIKPEGVQENLQVDGNSENSVDTPNEPTSQSNEPDLRSDEQKVLDKLRKDVSKLYSVFETLENKSILDTYGDIEIRGVAKKAGLPVTETNPKKIDNKFLEQIKAAIKKQAELEKAGNV
jgi:antitoxin component of RelBE/YafQ-DinJ toxin-antitoxin module